MDTNNQITKCGFVAIIGQTNVGKSTLTNSLTDAFVSIVSHKVQTTRRKTIGIRVINNTQIIFVDTPGIFKARDMLDKAMVSSALSQIEEDDVIMVLISAEQGITEHTNTIIDTIKSKNKKAILVINKIDMVEKIRLLELADELSKFDVFTKVFMVNALKQKGLKEVLKYLEEAMPVSPFLYDVDTFSTSTERELASEVTRQYIYQYVHQELPYNAYVETESFKEVGNSVTIHQVIYVEKENQRAIILGNGGSKIKTIGMASRKNLEKELGKKVSLYILVKVKAWRKDTNTLEKLGIIEK